MRTSFFKPSMLTLSLLMSIAASGAGTPPAGRLLKPLSFPAPECGDRPAFLNESRQEVAGGIRALPKAVLVAREAEMWIEGKSQDGEEVKMHTFQSFVRPKTRTIGRILCANTSKSFTERFSLIAPTLIDGSLDHKTGHSMWQFQVIADAQAYSVWNKKSPSQSNGPTVEAALMNLKTPYKLYQLSPREYELILQKDVAGTTQTLSIRYEAM